MVEKNAFIDEIFVFLPQHIFQFSKMTKKTCHNKLFTLPEGRGSRMSKTFLMISYFFTPEYFLLTAISRRKLPLLSKTAHAIKIDMKDQVVFLNKNRLQGGKLTINRWYKSLYKRY